MQLEDSAEPDKKATKNADHWNNYLEFVKRVNQVTAAPILISNAPVGQVNGSDAIDVHTGEKFKELDNTEKKYEDTLVQYLFGDNIDCNSIMDPSDCPSIIEHLSKNKAQIEPSIKTLPHEQWRSHWTPID